MKEIPLTRGMVAIVDDDVYEWASKSKWYAKKNGNRFYAARTSPTDPHTVYLHREIMKPAPGEQTDHKFGNTLDDRISEMRNVTNAQNGRGFRKLKGEKSSKFRGVSWHEPGGKWRAQIEKDGRLTYLGLFTNEESAARAYDKAALELFGEFAQLNFPAITPGSVTVTKNT